MCNSHRYTEKILAGSLSLTQDISRVIPLTSLSSSWQQTNWSFAGGLLLCFIQCLLLFLLFLLELRVLLASQHVNTLSVITTCSTTAMAFRQPTASLIHLIGHLVLQQDRPTRWIKVQGSCAYPQGRSSNYESRRGQLSVESRLQLSWCDSWSSYQDSEELSTSFFWWRSRDEINVWLWFMNSDSQWHSVVWHLCIPSDI